MLKITKPNHVSNNIPWKPQVCVFIWSNNSSVWQVPNHLLQHNRFTLVNILNSLHWTGVCYFAFIYSQMLQNTWSLLVCCVAYGSKLVVSTLVFLWQKELLCGILMSGSVIQLSFSQENMASASLPSDASVVCEGRQSGKNIERTFLRRVTQGIYPHPQRRWWVPGVGPWRQESSGLGLFTVASTCRGCFTKREPFPPLQKE